MIVGLLQGRRATDHAQSRWLYARGLVGHEAHTTPAASRCALSYFTVSHDAASHGAVSYSAASHLQSLNDSYCARQHIKYTTTPPRCMHACRGERLTPLVLFCRFDSSGRPIGVSPAGSAPEESPEQLLDRLLTPAEPIKPLQSPRPTAQEQRCASRNASRAASRCTTPAVAMTREAANNVLRVSSRFW